MDRIPTFIKGLDEKMEGGIPNGHVVLVSGVAGSMKTLLVLHALYENVTRGNGKALYISLEEKRNLILRRAGKVGMKLAEIEDKFAIIDLGFLRKQLKEFPSEKVDWLESLINQIKTFKQDIGFDFLALDSLNALYAISDMKNPRDQLFYFFETLRDMNLTAFLITEMKGEDSEYGQYGVEEFLADGIIHTDLRRINSVMNLFVGVVKMRETKHDRKYYPLVITPNFEFEIVAK
ncbi:MAG: AAA family ATPase [Thermoplasmata archaeon]|nr:AAA family ATPase [Thermoplasmata archaeon]